MEAFVRMLQGHGFDGLSDGTRVTFRNLVVWFREKTMEDGPLARQRLYVSTFDNGQVNIRS